MEDKKLLKKGINIDLVYNTMESILETLNIQEQLKLCRELSYNMVSYYSDENKGILYREIEGTEPRTSENRRQACEFQRKLRDQCDFLAQSIVDYRTFDDAYIKNYDYAGSYLITIKKLEDRIKELENELYGEE